MFDPKLIFNILSSLIQKRRNESEIDDELQFHFDMMVEEYMASGMTTDQARKAALIRFGDINQVNDICHEINASKTSAWLQDLRSALKTLSANPGFALLSIFTLCIGIATTIVIFSILNTVLWRPIPYRESNQIVVVQETNAYGERVDTSFPNFLDLRDKIRSFEHVAAYSSGLSTITGGKEPERSYVASVSRDYFLVLGVEPLYGRLLLPDNHRVGAIPTVVVSHSFWQRQLGSEINFKDKKLNIDGQIFTVSGILPSDVNYPTEADLWIPSELFVDDSARSAHNLKLIARMKNGVNLGQFQTDLSNIGRLLEKDYPQSNAGQRFSAVSLREFLTESARPSLITLFCIVALVLIVACANVTNLLLLRDTARQTTIFSRIRLGASRFRLSRQLIIESVLLALFSSLVGLFISFLINDVLIDFVPSNVPGSREVRISENVLVFTFVITLLAGLFCGLIPALRISQIDDLQTINDKPLRSSPYSAYLVELIVSTELALTVVVLIIAGALSHNFWRLSQIDPGFNPEFVLTAQVSLPSTYYEEDVKKTEFYRRILERLSLLPGVQSVGLVNNLPLCGQNVNGTFFIEENPQMEHYAGFRIISPDYFQSLSIPLMKGRSFTELDNENSAPVTIISKNLAGQIWRDQNPVGRRIRFIGMDQKSDTWMTVIGIIGDVKHSGLNYQPWGEVYVPYSQRPFKSKDMTMVIKTLSPPGQVIDGVRHEIQFVDNNLPVQFDTMQQVLSRTLAPTRRRTVLLILFAFTAIVLTTIGFYIVMKHEIADYQQSREQRTRLSRADIFYHLVRKGLFLSTAGVIVGSIAVAAILLIQPAFFFGVKAPHPFIFAATAVIVLTITLLISFKIARETTKSNLIG